MAFEGYSERGTGSEERGPGSFSFAPPGSPQAQANEQAVQTRASTVGGQASSQRLTYQTAPADKTFESMIGFADKAFGEKLGEIKQEQFLKGMQQAASGEALTEIVNEQPWFTRIFGPSGAADGARAYTATTAVTDWANQQELDMHELRKVSPDQIPAYLSKAVTDRKTGDLTTDVMIGMQIMKDAPALMKRHARENYKFQQEEAVKARYTAMSSAATSLQIAGAADKDMYTPEEVDARVQNLYQALVLKPGEDPESQQATLKTFVEAQAAGGNFHVLNRMEKDGIFNDLKPEAQAAFTKYLRSSRLQQAQDAGELYSDKIFQVSAAARLGKLSANEVRAAHDAINAENTKLTGNDFPVVRKATVISDQWSAMQYVKAMQEQGAKAAFKEDQAAQTLDSMRHALATGSTQQALANAEHDKHDIQVEFLARYDRAPSPEAKAAILTADAVGGMANKFLKENFSRAILSAPDDRINDDFIRTYGQWRALNAIGSNPDFPSAANGQAATAMYFPGDHDRLMADFHSALGGRDPATFGDAAWQDARSKFRASKGADYGKGQRKEAEKAITKAVDLGNSWFSKEFELTPSSLRNLTNGMAADWVGNSKSMDSSLVPGKTLANARANGWEIGGNYAWHVDPNRPRIETYFPTTDGKTVVTPIEMGHGINDTLKERIKLVTNKSPDDVSLYRVQDDKAGNAVFQAMVWTGEENPYLVQFNSKDVYESAKAKRLKQKPSAAASNAALKVMPKFSQSTNTISPLQEGK